MEHPSLIAQIKARGRGLANPLARQLARTGIDPNALTLLGLALSFVSAVVIATGAYLVGGVLFLLASALDGVDGAVARASGRTSSFGAFLDSLADRYAEAAVLVGLLISLDRAQNFALVIAAVTGLVGSLLVSYARARAEGLGVDCEIGLFQRPERVLLLTAGLLLSAWLLAPVLWLLAIVTNVTVIQRVFHVRQALAARDTPADGL